jgi:diguanylate cyclase (GGDEF)-like protein
MGEMGTQAAELQSASERLLEEGWEARERPRASQRELRVEAAAAAVFTIVALVLFLFTGAVGHGHPGTMLMLIAAYMVVARVEFPVGAGYVVPTQLVLVPMLVMLPPGDVPLMVAIALVSNTALDWARGRAAARRMLSSIPDAWHAVGPAGVLLLAGSPVMGFHELPLIGIAFVACCLVDLGTSLARVRLIGLVPDLRAQLQVIVLVWAVDASLAPVGFLTAVATERGSLAIVFVMPLAFLLWMLARDRSKRIEQAHGRLKLVEHERVRLQSAVRRLGDAFAAKLELDGLLEILLHGSVEALDAAAGRLDLPGLPDAPLLETGTDDALSLLRAGAGSAAAGDPTQTEQDESWIIRLPVQIDACAQEVTGTLAFARRDRAFEADEISLIELLVGKAQLAAGEILTHHALREQAVTDALTGLGNRRKLSTDLAVALEEAASGRPSLLLLFDLDGFKGYNDTFGHLAGDALLTRLAAKLTDAVAGHGSAYRLGGDEFCARLDLNGSDPDALIAQTAEALTETGRHFSIRASLGVVVLPHEADSPDHALQLADERMYANKRDRPGGARNQARDVLMLTMQAKQPDLNEHSSGVASLATRVARQLGLSGEALDEIARSAELHDVGKVGIPDAILNKPAALDPAEWEFMHQHTILGERILHAAPALRPVARLVRASHERWDGTGYPDGLAGEAIPLGARIVAVCDAFEAMTTDRPYRQAMTVEAACRELRSAAGTQFDPQVVDAFLVALQNADSDEERDAVHDAAAHVRTLLRTAPGPLSPASVTPSLNP